MYNNNKLSLLFLIFLTRREDISSFHKLFYIQLFLRLQFTKEHEDTLTSFSIHSNSSQRIERLRERQLFLFTKF